MSVGRSAPALENKMLSMFACCSQSGSTCSPDLNRSKADSLPRAMRRRDGKQPRAFSEKQNAVHFLHVLCCAPAPRRCRAKAEAAWGDARPCHLAAPRLLWTTKCCACLRGARRQDPHAPPTSAGVRPIGGRAPWEDVTAGSSAPFRKNEMLCIFCACFVVRQRRVNAPYVNRTKADWLPRAMTRRDG